MASLLLKLGKVVPTVVGVTQHSGSLIFGGASEGAYLVGMRYLLICIYASLNGKNNPFRTIVAHSFSPFPLSINSGL